MKEVAFAAVRQVLKPMFESGALSKEVYKAVAQVATRSLVTDVGSGLVSALALDMSLGGSVVRDAVSEAMQEQEQAAGG